MNAILRSEFGSRVGNERLLLLKEDGEIMKYYVVADVHGFYSELIKALTQKGWFDDKGPRKLIVCGDLFDRGEQANEMQKFIVELMEKDEIILIRGNHEDLMVEFVEHLDYWMDTRIFYSHHWQNGTVETMLRLVGLDLNVAYARPNLAAGKMRQTPYFKKILPAMRNFYETDRYIFVHGWIPCDAFGEQQYRPREYFYRDDWRKARKKDWELARWYNGMDAAAQGVIEKEKTIVCGHYRCSYGHEKYENGGVDKGINYAPYYGNGIIAIDGSTCHSHIVNCLVLED